MKKKIVYIAENGKFLNSEIECLEEELKSYIDDFEFVDTNFNKLEVKIDNLGISGIDIDYMFNNLKFINIKTDKCEEYLKSLKEFYTNKGCWKYNNKSDIPTTYGFYYYDDSLNKWMLLSSKESIKEIIIDYKEGMTCYKAVADFNVDGTDINNVAINLK